MAELSGDLSVGTSNLFDKLNYVLAYSNKDHQFHEFYYNENKTAQNQIMNASLWATKNSLNGRFVTGLGISGETQISFISLCDRYYSHPPFHTSKS